MTKPNSNTTSQTAPDGAAATGNQKGVLIKTWGCQMNVYDSDRMADVLAPLG